MGDAVVVVAVRNKGRGLLDGPLGIARRTRNAGQSHHTEVVEAIAQAKQLVRLAA